MALKRRLSKPPAELPDAFAAANCLSCVSTRCFQLFPLPASSSPIIFSRHRELGGRGRRDSLRRRTGRRRAATYQLVRSRMPKPRPPTKFSRFDNSCLTWSIPFFRLILCFVARPLLSQAGGHRARAKKPSIRWLHWEHHRTRRRVFGSGRKPALGVGEDVDVRQTLSSRGECDGVLMAGTAVLARQPSFPRNRCMLAGVRIQASSSTPMARSDEKQVGS